MTNARRTIRTTLGTVLVAAALTGTVAGTAAHADGRQISGSKGSQPGARLTLTARDADAVVPLAPVQAALSQIVPSNPSVNGVPVSAFDARLITDVNQARAAAGLGALVVTAGTEDIARTWSAQMVLSQTLAHNPGYVGLLSNHGSDMWTTCAENVGYGPADNADTLFNAYMNSPHHRDNILGASSRYVGIATRVDATGRAWNTMDFVNDYSTPYGAPQTTV